MTWLKSTYDAANRLIEVKRDDGSTNGIVVQTFVYGATNARLSSTEAGINQTTYYAMAGGQALVEYTESGGATNPVWSKSYIYMGGGQLSTITPNGAGETVEYNHPDRLGTRLITNQATSGSSEQATLPFGAALNAESTRTNNNKRFTSYDRSAATGLDYAVNRTYDSGQGKFTQVDPIDMDAVDLLSPQTLNLYSYCGNDPINHTDSDGLFWGSLFKWIGKAFNVISTILKWVAIAVAAVAISLAVFASGGTALAFLGYIGGIFGKVIGKLGFIAITQGGEISVGIGGKVFAGFYGVGAISSLYQERTQKGDDEVITVTTNCPKIGTAPFCPGMGIGVPAVIIGPLVKGALQILKWIFRGGWFKRAAPVVKRLPKFPAGVDRAVTNKILRGEAPRDALSAQQRELAAQFYEETAKNTGGTLQNATKLFNETRAKYLREGGTPPGGITEWMQRNNIPRN